MSDHDPRRPKRQIRSRLPRWPAGQKPDKSVISGLLTERRTQILVLLNERVAARSEIARELGIDPEHVKYDLRVLMGLGLVREVRRDTVRGATRVFYEATKKLHLDRLEWESVPDSMKGSIRVPLFRVLVDDARAAIEGDTFDSLDGAHMSWVPMIVDRPGWERIVKLLDDTLEEVEQIKDESAERLLAEDAEGESISVSMLGYESFNEKRKVGPSADDANLDEEIK